MEIILGAFGMLFLLVVGGMLGWGYYMMVWYTPLSIWRQWHREQWDMRVFALIMVPIQLASLFVLLAVLYEVAS